MEEFEIDDVTYRAVCSVQQRKCSGDNQNGSDVFICVGELLGNIHHASTNERELGMNYQRKSMSEIFAAQKEKV